MKRFSEYGKKVSITFQDLSNICYFETEETELLISMLQIARLSALNGDKEKITFSSPEIVEYLKGIDYVVCANMLEKMSVEEIESLCIKTILKPGEIEDSSDQFDKVLAKHSSYIDALWNTRDELDVDTPKEYMVPSFYGRAKRNLSTKLNRMKD